MIEKVWKLTEKGITDYNGKVGSLEDVVNILNNYHYKQNNDLKKINELKSEIKRLKEDNEELKKENNNLKKALWEAEENYLYEAYYDNPIRKEDKLKDLKEDFKRGYWND